MEFRRLAAGFESAYFVFVAKPNTQSAIVSLLKRGAVTSVAWMLVGAGCFGREYLLNSWGVDEGLPQSAVTDVAQTRDGYLWVGTAHAGVARFDGVEFATFYPENTPGLKSPAVRRILADARGTLWINTQDTALTSVHDGMFRLVLTNGARVQSVLKVDQQEVLFSTDDGNLLRGPSEFSSPAKWITIKVPECAYSPQFCTAREGTVWYRRRDGQLGRVTGDQCSLVPLTGLAGENVNALATDSQQRLWVGTDKELALRDGDTFRNLTPTNDESGFAVERLIFSGRDELWVQTASRLRKCVNQQWTSECLQWTNLPISSGNLALARGDAHGGLWLAQAGSGVWYIEPDGTSRSLNQNDEIAHSLVQNLCEDREGNIWLGAGPGSLWRIRPRLFQVIGRNEGLQDVVVSSVCEDHEGGLWVGSHNGAITQWRGGRCMSVPPGDSPLRGVGAVVAPRFPNGVWVGTSASGLNSFHDQLWEPALATAPELRSGVHLLAAAASGKIYLGNLAGVFSWDGGQFLPIRLAETISDRPAAFQEDHDGNLWVCTNDGELRRLRGGRWESFRPTDKVTRKRFWALHVDNEGVVWVGTLVGGLLRFHEGKFQRFTTENGLPSDTVTQILEDDRGNLWLGTRAGIVAVRKSELTAIALGQARCATCRVFGKNDGLPTIGLSSETQPTCVTARDGKLFFATVSGVTFVDPNQMAAPQPAPPVAIQGFRVDGEPVGESRWRSPINSSASNENLAPRSSRSAAARTLRLSPGRHYLEIAYAGLSYSAPDQVRYRHRLVEPGAGWIEAGSHRSANFNDLPPGEYVFQVTACNGDGVWNQAGASLHFSIPPYYWQTWWFKLAGWLGGVVLFSGIVAAVLRRRHQLRLQALEQQRAIERERTRIARDMHDELGSRLTKAGMLTQAVVQGLGEELTTRQRLTTLGKTVEEMTLSMDELVWVVNPKHDTLDGLANYLVRYTQEFLAETSLECQLDVPANLSPGPLTSQARHNLFLAFKEALRNIVRHAQARRVHVILGLAGGVLRLEVADDGRGFDPKKVKHQARGLENMRERLASVGGTCVIESVAGQGTRVIFELPFGF